MLIISNKQLTQISELFNKSFEINALKYLSEKYPDWKASNTPDELMTIVTEGIKRGSQHNITIAEDVRIFLEYVVLHGLHFEDNVDNEWASNILRIRNISGSEKISRMLSIQPLNPD